MIKKTLLMFFIALFMIQIAYAELVSPSFVPDNKIIAEPIDATTYTSITAVATDFVGNKGIAKIDLYENGALIDTKDDCSSGSTCTFVKTIYNRAAGSYDYYAIATDLDDNTIQSRTATVNFRGSIAPVLEVIPDIAVNEGDLVNLSDYTNLTYSGNLSDLSWEISSPFDDQFFYQTDYDDAGNYTVTARVSDPGGDYAEQSFNLSILDVIPVSVNLQDPADGALFNVNNVTFNCSALSFNADLADISLYTNHLGFWAIRQSSAVSGASAAVVFTEPGIPDGVWEWNCYAEDVNGEGSFAPQNYTFTVDTAAPVLSNMQANNITNESAVIEWGTDEPADSEVLYDIQSGNLTMAVSDANFVTNHSAALAGLQPGTTYYFAVSSKDAVNNTGLSPEYNFTTLANPSNNAPYFLTPAVNNSVQVNTSFLYDVDATDDDAGDSLMYYDDIAQFDIEPGAGFINFTPDTVGLITGTITVCDDSGFPNNCTTQPFSLDVVAAPVNNAPTFTTAPVNTSVSVGIMFGFTVVAWDLDGDNLTFYDDASQFDIDMYNGVISFAPSVVELITGTITVCDDSGFPNNCTNQPFTLDVVAGIPTSGNIIINEIMYDPAGTDTDHEWIEIYNADSISVNISGWRFNEAGTNHQLSLISGSEVLAPGDYAVIVQDDIVFMTDHPDFSGNLFDSSFSLSNTGEYLTLNNASLGLVDEVDYLSSWGLDLENSSLELINASLDNNVGSNWQTSYIVGGTPGQANSVPPPNTAPYFTTPAVNADVEAGYPFVTDVDATDDDAGDILTYYDDIAQFDIDANNGLIDFIPSVVELITGTITVCDDSGEPNACANQPFSLNVTPTLNCTNVVDDLYVNENTVLCPGTYNVNDTNGDGVIIINASGVTLNGNGAVIVGDGTGIGVFMENKNNATILGCEIENFDEAMHLNLTSGSVVRNNIVNQTNHGIHVLNSDNVQIENNAIEYSEAGIEFDYVNGSNVNDNYVAGSLEGINIYHSDNNMLDNNVVENSNRGILASYSSDNVFYYAQLNNNNENILFRWGSNFNSFLHSTLSSPVQYDVHLTDDNVVHFLNTTFDSASVSVENNSLLRNYWNLNAYAEDGLTGLPVANASVNVYQQDGSLEASAVTQSTGYTMPLYVWVIEEDQDSAGVLSYNPHTVNVTAAGYKEASVQVNFNDNTQLTITLTPLDLADPVVTLVSPADGSVDTDGSVTVQYSVTDDMAANLVCTVYSDVSGAWTNDTTQNVANGALSSYTYPSAADGVYTWNVECSDGSNSAFAAADWTFEVNTTVPDTNAPVVTLVSPADGSVDTDGSVTVQYSVTDDMAAVLTCNVWSDTSGAWQADTTQVVANGSSSTYDYNSLSNGDYNWNVECSDGSNSAFASANFTFSVNVPGGLNGYVLDNLGAGIPGATVEAKQGAAVMDSATTAVDGSYSLTLNEGTYTVLAYRTGYYDNETTGVSVAGQNTTQHNATLQTVITTGSLAGNVTDVNNNIYGATVEVKQGAAVVASAQTDENGAYSFGSLNVGDYNITIWKSGFINNNAVNYVLTIGVNTYNAVLAQNNAVAGGVSGTIYNISDFSTVADATINVYKAGTSTLVQVVRSNETGYYQINGLPTINTYDLEAAAAGFTTQTFATSVGISAGAINTDNDAFMS
jgi:hypothetical protein